MVQKSAVNKDKVLILAGPTGVGKTEIALSIYDILKCEIISADSMQIYRECNVGTAKLNNELLKKYPHHIVNIKSIEEEYSTAEFKKNTESLIIEINQKGFLPIIVGGTSLYIESLIFPYEFANCPKQNEYRDYLNNFLKTNGKEELYNILYEIDNSILNYISVNDTKKIIRLLEIYHYTNKKPSELQCVNKKACNSPYDYFIIFLNKDRELLYDSINRRVDDMVNNGLIQEAKLIYDKQKELNRPLQVASAIGYKEFFNYFEGNDSLENCINLVKQHSRNYAKRQITWFKRYSDNIAFLEYKTNEDKEKILSFIKEKYYNFIKK